MRYDKKRLTLIGVIAVLVVVLLVLVIVAVAGMKGPAPSAQPGGTTKPSVNGQPTDDDILKTPYGRIVFPENLVQYLKVERTEKPQLQLEFIAELGSGKVQKLFTVWFGAAENPAAGQVVSEDGAVAGIYVTIHTLMTDDAWQATEIAIVNEMQEALNDVMASLNVTPLGSPIPGDPAEDEIIETPYGDLHFPGRWAQELQTAVDQSDGYEVVFSAVINGHDPIRLFAVNFGGSQGTVVHTVYTENDVPCEVRLRTFPLEMEGWSAVDQATARAMQEDLNHLLAQLRGE